MLVTITRVINWSILFAFIACFSYQMIYLITPYIKKGKEHKTLQLHRYAVLIAARNEENVLGDLLDSIHDIQTVISCTGLDEFVKNRFKINKIFKVVEGKVISEN